MIGWKIGVILVLLFTINLFLLDTTYERFKLHSTTEVFADQVIEPNSTSKKRNHFLTLFDCKVFSDLKTFDEMFYLCPETRPCGAVVNEGVSVNYGEGRQAFYDCEPISDYDFAEKLFETDWFDYPTGAISETKAGCFVNKKDLDSNSSFVGVFRINKPIVI